MKCNIFRIISLNTLLHVYIFESFLNMASNVYYCVLLKILASYFLINMKMIKNKRSQNSEIIKNPVPGALGLLQ